MFVQIQTRTVGHPVEFLPARRAKDSAIGSHQFSIRLVVVALVGGRRACCSMAVVALVGGRAGSHRLLRMAVIAPFGRTGSGNARQVTKMD